MRASITTKLRARQHAGATRQTSCSDFFKVFACIFFAHVYALLPAYWHDICNFPFRGTGRDGTGNIRRDQGSLLDRAQQRTENNIYWEIMEKIALLAEDASAK